MFLLTLARAVAPLSEKAY